jgi:uncharacterized Zn finger protein
MKSKYGPRYLKVDFMDMTKHWAVGVQYNVKGSRGDDYTIEFTPKGFTCNCIGMSMHGKCKHTKAIADRWQYACSDNFVPGVM